MSKKILLLLTFGAFIGNYTIPCFAMDPVLYDEYLRDELQNFSDVSGLQNSESPEYPDQDSVSIYEKPENFIHETKDEKEIALPPTSNDTGLNDWVEKGKNLLNNGKEWVADRISDYNKYLKELEENEKTFKKYKENIRESSNTALDVKPINFENIQSGPILEIPTNNTQSLEDSDLFTSIEKYPQQETSTPETKRQTESENMQAEPTEASPISISDLERQFIAPEIESVLEDSTQKVLEIAIENISISEESEAAIIKPSQEISAPENSDAFANNVLTNTPQQQVSISEDKGESAEILSIIKSEKEIVVLQDSIEKINNAGKEILVIENSLQEENKMPEAPTENSAQKKLEKNISISIEQKKDINSDPNKITIADIALQENKDSEVLTSDEKKDTGKTINTNTKKLILENKSGESYTFFGISFDQKQLLYFGASAVAIITICGVTYVLYKNGTLKKVGDYMYEHKIAVSTAITAACALIIAGMYAKEHGMILQSTII